MKFILFFLAITSNIRAKEFKRSPAAIGSFYPSNPFILKEDILNSLKQAQKHDFAFKNQIILFVPHAGYHYIQSVLGKAYAQLLSQEFDHIVLITQPLDKKFSGSLVFWKTNTAFETPLGEIPIDPKAKDLARILNQPALDLDSFFQEEKNIELQLPYLQIILKNPKIIPILVSDFSSAENVSQVLVEALKNKKVLYIIITNLDQDGQDAKKILLQKNTDALLRHIKKGLPFVSCESAAYLGMRLQKELHLPDFFWLAFLHEPHSPITYAACISGNIQTKPGLETP